MSFAAIKPIKDSDLELAMRVLFEVCEREGKTVTITLEPLRPLRMGHYAHRVEIRDRHPGCMYSMLALHADKPASKLGHWPTAMEPQP